jgi:hypothetical protein
MHDDLRVQEQFKANKTVQDQRLKVVCEAPRFLSSSRRYSLYLPLTLRPGYTSPGGFGGLNWGGEMDHDDGDSRPICVWCRCRAATAGGRRGYA